MARDKFEIAKRIVMLQDKEFHEGLSADELKELRDLRLKRERA